MKDKKQARKIRSEKAARKVLEAIAKRLRRDGVPYHLSICQLTIYESASKSRQLKALFDYDHLQDIAACWIYYKGADYGYGITLHSRYKAEWVNFLRFDNIDKIIKRVKEMVKETQQYLNSKKEENDEKFN